MSTKTSIKRIALVAVAALGFGMVSTVAANAANSSPTVGTAAQAVAVGGSATTTVGLTIVTTTGTTIDSGSTVTLSVPTGSSVTLADRDGSYSTATTAAFDTTGATSGVSAAVSSAGVISGTASADAASDLGTITIIPDVPGLYSVTVTAGTTAVAYIQAAGIAGTVGTAGLGTAAVSATTGGIATFTFTNPSTGSSGDVYRFSSSGVGSIYAATGVAANGTSANNPVPTNGSAADWSQGATWTRSNASSGTATVNVTSSVAGVQTVTVTKIDATTGAPVTAKTISITYGSAVSVSSASTAYMAAGDATTASISTNALPRSAAKAAGTAIATIVVTLVNSNGAADARANTLKATVSGVGFVDVNGTVGSLSNSSQRVDSNTEADDTRFVRIYSDGTSGTGSVTLTVTDVDSAAVLTLGTWSFTSTGSAASIAVSSTNFSIGRAGYTTGGSVAARATTTEVGEDNADGTAVNGVFTAGISTPSHVIVVKDSSGNAVTASSAPVVISSDTSVVSGGTCTLDNGAYPTGYSSSSNGIGYYNCNFTTVAGVASGKSATLTYRIADPASTTGGYLTATAKVTVGGTAAATTLAFDKASYEPGEGMTVTRTCKDASGNPCYDGYAAAAVSFSKAIGGTAPGADIYVGGTVSSDNSRGAKTVFAPVVGGDFTATMTGKTAAATADVTATATVSSTEAQAAVDAANEATDAALIPPPSHSPISFIHLV